MVSHRRERGTFLGSFEVALRGIGETWSRERNFRVQVSYVGVVVGLLAWLRPEKIETLLVTASLFALLSAELMNTALERTVDLVTAEHHPLARSAKDIAAGSVLVIAIGTALLCLGVLAPYLPWSSALAFGGFWLGVSTVRFGWGWSR